MFRRSSACAKNTCKHRQPRRSSKQNSGLIYSPEQLSRPLQRELKHKGAANGDGSYSAELIGYVEIIGSGDVILGNLSESGPLRLFCSRRLPSRTGSLDKYSIEQRATQIFDAHIHMASLICGNVSFSPLGS